MRRVECGLRLCLPGNCEDNVELPHDVAHPAPQTLISLLDILHQFPEETAFPTKQQGLSCQSHLLDNPRPCKVRTLEGKVPESLSFFRSE